MPDMISLAERYRAAVDAQEAAAMRRLVDAYGGLYRRLQGDIDALLLATDGKTLTPAQIQRLAQYTRLMEDTAAELTRYSTWLETELYTAAQSSLRAGLEHSAGFLRGAGVVFRALSPDVVETLLGFLAADSPLWERLKLLAGERSKDMAAMILDGIMRGRGPRSTAAAIRKALGIGLSDSLRMMRTIQLYTYREASRATYVQNRDVVTGWVWWARLVKGGVPDGLVCASCIAMHGTLHAVEETLNDHHNGRCIALPLTAGRRVTDLVSESGADWFTRQDEAYQRMVLGQGKFEAWKAGKFDFSALSVERDDPVYGSMRYEATLKSLVPQ